jgi:hypothetical protein
MGKINIPMDKPFLAAGGSHPLIVWRHGKLIYYLVGDSMDSAKGAANLLSAQG